WWEYNLRNKDSSQLFGFVVWLLWGRRNRRVFDQVQLSVQEIISQAMFWGQLWSTSWKAHQLSREAPRNARQAQLIGWRLGDEGWFTLNSDGSLHTNLSLAAAGGLIRDDQGRFVVGFVTKLGSCSVVRAEMRGIVEGMSIAWNRGIRKLRIQSDSATAIKILSDTTWVNHQHSHLVRMFRELSARNWEISIEHIYREANNAADFIANSGHNLELGTSIFTSLCNSLLYWIRYDLIGSYLPRWVNNTS
ncbi:Putative ribonuclease H protein At1g65750, partial [Linum perenne]